MADGRREPPEARLAAAVGEIFGPLCRAAWLSGSYVYRGAQAGASDVDVVLLFAEEVAVPADAAMQARIRAFVDAYLAAHAAAGLDPDLEFPGEYVAAASLAETLAWRGLAMEGGVARAFPASPSSDYWPGRPERWFNAWLSMTALSRFLAGDRAAWEAAKLAAWTQILRFLLLRAGGEALGEEELWERLDQFGVKPRYHALRAMEGPWVERALAALEAEGFARRETGRIVPDAARLRAWERALADEIARGEREQGPLLLPPDLHAALGAYAAERWAALSDPEDAAVRL